MYFFGNAGLFITGILGNLYHHYLLSTLRSKSNKKGTTTTTTTTTTRYVAPKGGLFEYVAAPHYFFELIGWLGIAVVSGHLNVYLIFASMCSYLSGRSVAQNEFNREKFEDAWPATRKSLVPFLF